MKENQRIRLSKQMLKDSLTKLLVEKSIHKISVREICYRAQINRTTFYKYYGSQYDLLKDMETEVLSQIEKYLINNNGSEEDSLQQIAKIITFANENIDLCRILFNNNVDTEFPEKLMNLPLIKQMVASQLHNQFNEDELEYIFIFIVNGGFSIIKNWINKDNREAPEVVAALFNKTFVRLFSTPNPS